MSPIRNILIVP